MARRAEPPSSLPFNQVAFEFIILSTRGEPIPEEDFSHELLMSERGRAMSREARLLLQCDCLKLRCEKRTFVDGRPHREPEIFRTCRHMANVGQINMGPTDHDLITIGRGAFRLIYEGPTAHNHAHLELMVHAAETVRSMRRGLVVDFHARQIWGEHSWEAQLSRHHGLGAREHFKIEMSHSNHGVTLNTRGLSKFGLPDLRMASLPHDLSGIAAISMTSIALDLVHAEPGIDPRRHLRAPIVAGEFAFDYHLPPREEGHPAGIFQMAAGVDGEAPSALGLLEILSRLRRRYVDGETFHDDDKVDPDVMRRAQEALPRLKEKFGRLKDNADYTFVVQRQGAPEHEAWVRLLSIEGSTLRGRLAEQPKSAPLAFDQTEVADWLIMRGGDVEDGGFGMARM